MSTLSDQRLSRIRVDPCVSVVPRLDNYRVQNEMYRGGGRGVPKRGPTRVVPRTPCEELTHFLLTYILTYLLTYTPGRPGGTSFGRDGT